VAKEAQVTAHMPKEPYQFLSFAPGRSSAAGGNYKVHESLSRAKSSVAYHGWGSIYQWDMGWILLFEVPRPDWRKPKLQIDWDACKA
jgi:hypothetical protein